MPIELNDFVGKCVNIITNDGKVIVGYMHAFDASTNVAITHAHERIFSLKKGVVVSQLGLFLIRGDNIAIIGILDEELDAEIEYTELKAPPLPPIQH
ncbi:hypothetical protein MDAP_002364 [Mitosporidium daphniae]